jgi:hypothetical protein
VERYEPSRREDGRRLEARGRAAPKALPATEARLAKRRPPEGIHPRQAVPSKGHDREGGRAPLSNIWWTVRDSFRAALGASLASESRRVARGRAPRMGARPPPYGACLRQAVTPCPFARRPLSGEPRRSPGPSPSRFAAAFQAPLRKPGRVPSRRPRLKTLLLHRLFARGRKGPSPPFESLVSYCRIG